MFFSNELYFQLDECIIRSRLISHVHMGISAGGFNDPFVKIIWLKVKIRRAVCVRQVWVWFHSQFYDQPSLGRFS